MSSEENNTSIDAPELSSQSDNQEKDTLKDPQNNTQTTSTQINPPNSTLSSPEPLDDDDSIDYEKESEATPEKIPTTETGKIFNPVDTPPHTNVNTEAEQKPATTSTISSTEETITPKPQPVQPKVTSQRAAPKSVSAVQPSPSSATPSPSTSTGTSTSTDAPETSSSAPQSTPPPLGTPGTTVQDLRTWLEQLARMLTNYNPVQSSEIFLSNRTVPPFTPAPEYSPEMMETEEQRKKFYSEFEELRESTWNVKETLGRLALITKRKNTESAQLSRTMSLRLDNMEKAITEHKDMITKLHGDIHDKNEEIASLKKQLDIERARSKEFQTQLQDQEMEHEKQLTCLKRQLQRNEKEANTRELLLTQCKDALIRLTAEPQDS